jgi:hypothetical protein
VADQTGNLRHGTCDRAVPFILKSTPVNGLGGAGDGMEPARTNEIGAFSILCLTRDFIRQGHAREKRKEYRATRTRSQAIDRG